MVLQDTESRAGGVKAYQGGRGYPDVAHAAAVGRYLKGIHFPATKEALIQRARELEAPVGVLSLLARFEERCYYSATEVTREVCSAE